MPLVSEDLCSRENCCIQEALQTIVNCSSVMALCLLFSLKNIYRKGNVFEEFLKDVPDIVDWYYCEMSSQGGVEAIFPSQRECVTA